MALNDEKQHPLIAWEGFSGFIAAVKIFFPLCASILFKPVDFFRMFLTASEASSKQRLLRAITFALISGYIKFFLDIANLYWFKLFAKGILSSREAFELSLIPANAWLSPLFILRPVFMFLVTVILVAFGCKFIFGFEKSVVPALLVVCYRSAADLFYAIPLIGSIFALSWSAALLIVGLREVYKLGFLRALFAGIIMPTVILFSVLLAAGPALNRAVFSFFPEMKTQVVKINDMTAFVNTFAIGSANQQYKKELGFYPAHLGVLKKYLAGAVAADITDPLNSGGYRYLYTRIDDGHYKLIVEPVQIKETGNMSFYSDEKGEVHSGSPDGPVIKDVSEINKRAL